MRNIPHWSAECRCEYPEGNHSKHSRGKGQAIPQMEGGKPAKGHRHQILNRFQERQIQLVHSGCA